MFGQNIKFTVILLLLLTVNAVSQTMSDIDAELQRLLHKNDLRELIADAELSDSNNLPSIYRRLNLYQRIANGPKMELAIKQALDLATKTESPQSVTYSVFSYLKDPLITDSDLHFRFLKINFSEDIYGNFVTLCSKNINRCDVPGFDRWLEQKADEKQPESNPDLIYIGEEHRSIWLKRRLDWRKRLGLNNSEILEAFTDAVRKDPKNLRAALAFINVAERVDQIEWLVEVFSSEQAYAHYEIGRTLSNKWCCNHISGNEQLGLQRAAKNFLLRSLALPYDKTDGSLMYVYRFSRVSIAPNIKNPEKQLRFWTKTNLAEVYKQLGMSIEAQPLVEELIATDTSDIIDHLPNHLAGAVQAQTGIRNVEAKILNDAATKQNTYRYWRERIQYYYGRNEPEEIASSYLAALSAVPFDPSREDSRAGRIDHIEEYIRFVTERDHNLDESKIPDLDVRLERLRKNAEEFLTNELEKYSTNIFYAYPLAIAVPSDFEDLSRKIRARSPDLIVKAASTDLLHSDDRLISRFFYSNEISQIQKDALFNELVKIGEKMSFQRAWLLCDSLDHVENTSQLGRLIPILSKNLKIIDQRSSSLAKNSETFSKLNDFRRKYAEILFSTYLRMGDWKSAEVLMSTYPSVHHSQAYDWLAITAARANAPDDAIRLWKIKANFYRRDMSNLSILKSYAPVAEGLLKFYKEMEEKEPFSPVPEMALEILK